MHNRFTPGDHSVLYHLQSPLSEMFVKCAIFIKILHRIDTQEIYFTPFQINLEPYFVKDLYEYIFTYFWGHNTDI